MSEILDNQEVTSEMLNNIAIDLGIPDFNGFGEEKFGVEKLNNITGDLVGKGILNVLDRCSLIYNNEHSDTTGLLTIGTGVIVFGKGDDDTYRGAKLRITSPITVEIKKTENTVYVYAVNNTINNKIELRVIEEELLTDEDFLLLCQVENGIIKDKRKYSKSNVLGTYQEYQTETGSLSLNYKLDKDVEYLVKSIPLPTDFTPGKILFYYPPKNSDSYSVSYDNRVMLIYDINNNKIIEFAGSNSAEKMHVREKTPIDAWITIDDCAYGHGYMKVVLEGDYLNIYMKKDYKGYGVSAGNYIIDFI